MVGDLADSAEHSPARIAEVVNNGRDYADRVSEAGFTGCSRPCNEATQRWRELRCRRCLTTDPPRACDSSPRLVSTRPTRPCLRANSLRRSPAPPIDLLQAIAGHDAQVAAQQLRGQALGAGCDPARQAAAAGTTRVRAERPNGTAGKRPSHRAVAHVSVTSRPGSVRTEGEEPAAGDPLRPPGSRPPAKTPTRPAAERRCRAGGRDALPSQPIAEAAAVAATAGPAASHSTATRQPRVSQDQADASRRRVHRRRDAAGSADELNEQFEHLERQRQLLRQREEKLDRRQRHVDQMHDEITQLHREALELRLASEQVWTDLMEEFPSEELVAVDGTDPQQAGRSLPTGQRCAGASQGRTCRSCATS